MTKPARRYGGIPLADRQAERRAKLVDATIAVAGRLGREGASVAAICAEAGLTARYFYESFPNRDALFVEAFRKVQNELFADVQRAIASDDPVASALAGFYGALADHPGLARVFLLDLDVHDTAIRTIGEEAGRRLGMMLAPDARTPLARSGAVGAIVQIAKAWITGGFQIPVADVVATALPFTRASA